MLGGGWGAIAWAEDEESRPPSRLPILVEVIQDDCEATNAERGCQCYTRPSRMRPRGCQYWARPSRIRLEDVNA